MNPQEFDQLARAMDELPPYRRLAPLLELFSDPPPNAYLAQEYAGQLLMRFKPPCADPIDPMLRRVLPRWDRSVEQLPLYLREVFGPEAVLSCLDRLAEDGVDPERLDTVRFWFRAHREPG